MKRLLHFSFLLAFTLLATCSFGQLTLHGTVYDYFSKRPLDAVTIQSSSGRYAISDSTGKFTIPVSKKDSVWFSYLSKNTMKYPIDTIRNLLNFEIALYVDAAWLPEIKIRNKNYKQDSIANRQEYAKVFNFRKPTVRITSPSPNSYTPGSVTAGLDINEFINMFRFRRNRQLLSMQQRLEEQEKEKYVNHRYTKYLVGKLTQLKDHELDSFINLSKPSYDLLLYMNDLELGYYIQQIYTLYKNGGRIQDMLKPEEN
ncbi:hypothetical protein I5907_05900 [Panacibacter sp. DH6]|uniref:Carboxypeptidase-like regulatory domain-containing protein n=1 Tax=Panacibacter microcysteis TaxID=2793269 RepID=A0A931E655_9BACT|nr:hypothetical protein [Panacibacter microcysteis]MBG9375758.1 hypothetical protein [Panacibacter microcysteis]